MTTKTISGTYSAGYILHSNYSTVSITSSGSIGGFGLIVQAATVDNSGRIHASNGGYGVYMGGVGDVVNAAGALIVGGTGISQASKAGYAGGAAVNARAYADVTNGGIVDGGQGGGGANGVSQLGFDGGAGGAGVELTTGFLVNLLDVAGGAGGAGGAGVQNGRTYFGGGSGGQGGAGVVAGTGGRIVNASGSISGGAGGAGGSSPGVAPVGFGGRGGDGVVLNGAGAVYVESGRIAGGAGGAGYTLGAYADQGGVGVYLKAGGLVSVSSGATIVGGAAGVNTGSNGPPSGYGGGGVYLRAGGTVSNAGVIAGGGGDNKGADDQVQFGVKLADGGTVLNSGAITGGAYSWGVVLKDGGTITNSGSIADSAALYNGGNIYNDGAISAGLSYPYGDFQHSGAVFITSKSILVNGGATNSTASIGAKGAYSPGYYGVAVSGSGSTITNFGVITGATDAVKFNGAGDTLIVEEGSVFTGAVLGGGGTLELATGKGSLSAFNAGGDVTVSGSMPTTTFQNFGTLEIGKMGKFSLTGGGTGDGTVGAGQTLIDAGTLLIDNTLTIDGSLIVSKMLGNVRGAHFPTLAIEGGTAAFNKGTKLDVTFIDVDGASTVNVGTNLVYDGLWSQSAGDLNVAARDNLTFDAVTFIDQNDSFAGTFNGGGGVIFSGGTVSVNGLTLSGAFVDALSASLIVGSGGLTVAAGSLLSLETGEITGAAATNTLTNAGTILASGDLGGGQMTLVNDSGGVIDANTAAALIIDTGVAFINTVGTIESTGSGGVTVQSALANAGQIGAFAGAVTLNGSVSGSGLAQINGGTLVANSAFSQAVDFTGSSGELVLADSRSYTGTITGFSTSGGTELDLKDVGFVKSSEAKFSGTSSGGVLTVKDGGEVATIKLTGDYLSSTFVCSSDGSGGVLIEDPTPGASAPPSTHALVAAMAAMG